MTIDIRNLTKRYRKRDAPAVDGLTFTARPGRVTGFLGANGAGKSTTLRVLLGLDAADAGEARVAGHRYRDLDRPLRQVGALLDARDRHRARSARDHLCWLARAGGVPRRRVAEVLEITGLDGAPAGKPGRALSLGMGQRLGIAAALLGDPRVLVLDEPGNGLDPAGTVWLRTLLRSLADEGRTVLVSSHQLGEMALTADHLVVIDRGRLLADAPVTDVLASVDGLHVAVRAAGGPAARDRLSRALTDAGARVEPETADASGLRAYGLPAEEVGRVAARCAIPLLAMGERTGSLEDAFLRLVASGGGADR
ncbi:ATP-binding cassette domain-containing protein [Streptomyces sp. RFCAC02]|uniref:ABC transporter ATP-binding protein n=1 Tax=Streptomyces sp. RFCAC02 TaxID=2499143 RepID=UPI001021CAF3|nr:ATP-binding cassette domain-containing protein [Streptomyces sp. RFCAC02]